MAYATVDNLRSYLPQVDPGDAIDADMADILDRATNLVQNELGSKFVFIPIGTALPSAAAKTVFSEASQWLKLPPYTEGSITLIVEYGATTAITDYEERWDAGSGYLWREVGWAGLRYTVTAQWGLGRPTPAITELTLEVAVNLWRGKDRGMFQEIQGSPTSGATIRFIGGLTKEQKDLIAKERKRLTDGVW